MNKHTVEGDAACECVAYTIRTDYGTGVEHDVDRSSCDIHGQPAESGAPCDGVRNYNCPASALARAVEQAARCREDFVQVSTEQGGVWTFCDTCPRRVIPPGEGNDDPTEVWQI